MIESIETRIVLMQPLIQKDLLTWCDDLHQVKGNISQLQATLNQILTKAPSLDQYRELSTYLDNPNKGDASSIIDKTRNFLSSSQLKVAVRMKFLYDQGLLPFLLALSQINFKSVKSDKFVGYLLDYTPPRDIGSNLAMVLKQRVNSGKQVNIESFPPVLPPISNESLLNKILTDKSFRQPADFLELDDANDFNRSHNAKLGLRGKRLLEFALIEILDEKLPDIHEDDLYYLQFKLVSTSILTKLAFGYNLADNYKFHFSKEMNLDDKLAKLSNIFLAYIGGLALDGYSFAEIKLWIAKLYEPIIQDFNENNDTLKPLNKLALIELNFLFKQVTNMYYIPPQQTTLQFETLETDPHVVKLSINGQTLGIGTSSIGVEEAKVRAASDAFSNKQKIDEIIRIMITSYEELQKSKQNTPGPVSTNSSNDDDDDDEYSKHNNDNDSLTEEPYSPKIDSEEEYEPSIEGNAAINQVSAPSQSQDKQPAAYTNDKIHPHPYSTFPVPHQTPQPYGAPPPPPHQTQFQHHQHPPHLPNLPSLPPYPAAALDAKYPLDNNAKNTLYAVLGSNHLTPVYRFSKVGNDFQVSILVNDIVIGTSVDSNKKAASQRAAMNALSNKSLLNQLGVHI